MKLKDGIDTSVLLNYGFSKIEKQDIDEDSVQVNFDFEFSIGHSRRGQFYSLLVSELGRTINVYASKPDGDGTFISMPSVLVKMAIDGIIE